MKEIEIIRAGPADMERLSAALEHLSADLGDRHRAGANDLAAACGGANPACHGFLALLRDGTVIGAALVSPLYSTTRGAAGVYVSDLWVAPATRGSGLGRRLLGAVARFGAGRWQARFLKLTVYAENAEARVFYERLGFRPADRDLSCLLGGDQFDELAGLGQ